MRERADFGGVVVQAAGADGGLMEQAGVLVGEFQVEAAGLPIDAQTGLELSVLGGGDFAIELGVDEGFEIHDRPSD
jgi:hypothetical protein